MITSIPRWRALNEQTRLSILSIFACIGILYLAAKALPIHSAAPAEGLDFRVFWIAGKLWNSGGNPYGPAFIKEYLTTFGMKADALWLYPPYWYSIVSLFSLLPYQISANVWRISNFALVIAANHLIARALADTTRQKYLPLFLGGLGYACLMEATAMTIFLGQTSILIYFGFAAMIFGLLKGRPSILILGLTFLALKPQIGLLAFVAVATLRRYRWTILPAASICALATVSISITANAYASIIGFFVNLARQSGISANSPPNLVGFSHIAGHLLSYSTSLSGTLVLTSAAVICVVAVFSNLSFRQMSGPTNTQHELANLTLFMALIFLLVPLHTYDIVALAALPGMLLALPRTGKSLIGLGLLICFRPRNLSEALGITNPMSQGFPEAHLVSLAIVIILIGAICATITTRSRYET